MSTAIELRGVRCTVGARTLLEVGRLSIGAGERVAIVGHNGAGKSTLLRMLSGFIRPSAGKLSVLGHRLDAPLNAQALRSLRRETGQVLQGLHLVPRLTVLENVLIGSLGRVSGWRGWVRHYPEAERARAHVALAAVDLADKAAMRTDRLSGGERQKVAIARLLVQGPRLILADEPTAALDPSAAADVCSILNAAAAGATMVSVVHSTALLPVLADRVIGLARGRVVFDLPCAAVDDERLASLYRTPARPNGSRTEADPQVGDYCEHV